MSEVASRLQVGILTWHYYANVGSNLQAWAMQRVLSSMGFDARFVNYRKREFDGDRFPKGLVKGVCDALPLLPSFGTWRFQRDELLQTCKTYTPEGTREICDRMDAVVCGSDQIWAPNVFDPVYFLQGVSDRVRKVSYAASIGLSDIPADMRPAYRSLLSRFDSIGVREDQGRDLIRGELGLEATTVLDPTFLIGSREWETLAEAEREGDGPYAFCYFLGDPSRYADAVADAARRTGLPVVAYLPEAGDKAIPGCTVVRRMAVPEFLGMILGSSLVMTDSFHGIALSVNLGREFCAYRRFDEGDAIDQNSRVVNILGKLGLSDHLLPLHEFREPETDWEAVLGRLESERAASRSFLESALGGLGGAC